MSRRGPRSMASQIGKAKVFESGPSPTTEPEIRPITFQPLGRHKHVEQLLDVSANTVDRLIRQEGLPVIRLGGTVRFDLEAVRAWAVRRQLQQMKSEERQQAG